MQKARTAPRVRQIVYRHLHQPASLYPLSLTNFQQNQSRHRQTSEVPLQNNITLLQTQGFRIAYASQGPTLSSLPASLHTTFTSKHAYMHLVKSRRMDHPLSHLCHKYLASHRIPNKAIRLSAVPLAPQPHSGTRLRAASARLA